MDCLVTGCAVAQQEANEVYERNKAVANCIEDYGTLGIAKAFDIDEESKEGKESGAQANDGANANESLGKFNVVGFKIHIGTRWSTVLSSKE